MEVISLALTAPSFTIYFVQGDRGGDRETGEGRKGVRTSKSRAETRIQ